MKFYYSLLLLLLPYALLAQTGEMRVYTVAGSNTPAILGDGGPATAAGMGATEGVWMDADCNVYVTDDMNRRIRKIDVSSGIITTVAGSSGGFSGDGGPATDAKIKPYGLYVDNHQNIFIADAGNNRIRKVDASTGIISTYAGGGYSTSDDVPATNALLTDPPNVYGDLHGNIYLGERGRIRKVNSSGIITTIAGTGIFGLSGDGGPATSAQVHIASTMLFDSAENLLFADRGNSRIRKINMTTGIITTVAGTDLGYSGDGGPATNAQLAGPISFVIDKYGNLLIGDNGNDVMRKVDAVTGKISTIAGVGTYSSESITEGALATATQMHPEFLYLDGRGNIYYTQFGQKLRKITNYNPGLYSSGSMCQTDAVDNIRVKTSGLYPNPASDKITVDIENSSVSSLTILNCLGQTMYRQTITALKITVDVGGYPPGIYQVYITGADKIEVSKFIKQ